MMKNVVKILSLSCFVVLLLILGGCTKVSDYSFVDYGVNSATNEIVFADDQSTLGWVQQKAGTDKKMNRIFTANKDGADKQERISMELESNKALRLMGLYPSLGLFIYAIEYKNDNFGPVIQREAFYKFFNQENAHFIGREYLQFFNSDKGVMGLRVGDTLAYYQLSMNNTYAIDSKSSYNKDKKIISAFTDALMTKDQKKVIYTFEYDPSTQGYNQNKVLVSDFSGENRKELLASNKPLEIVELVNENTIKIKDGEEFKELNF